MLDLFSFVINLFNKQMNAKFKFLSREIQNSLINNVRIFYFFFILQNRILNHSCTNTEIKDKEKNNANKYNDSFLKDKDYKYKNPRNNK